MTKSVFAKFEAKHYPYRYACTILFDTIAGGTPADSKVAEGWLRTKTTESDTLIRQQIAEIMAERGIDKDAATAVVEENRHLVGFRKDDQGLYIEGRQIKAAIKEAASIAAAADRIEMRGWGKSNKGLKGWIAEHVIVPNDRIHLGAMEPSGVAQSFPKSFRGTSIQYTEYLEDVKASFEVTSDHEFTDDQWAAIWLTAERNGIGASRSQGYGTFAVVQWDKVG